MATPLQRFDASDREAAADLATRSDSDGLNWLIERAWNENLPLGSVFLELLQGANETLHRRNQAGELADGALAVAMGTLRIVALKWSSRLPRRSSLDAGSVLLVEPDESAPSFNAALYEIYCERAGWEVTRVGGANNARRFSKDFTTALILVNRATEIEKAREAYDHFGMPDVSLAFDASLAPYATDEGRRHLMNAGQVVEYLIARERSISVDHRKA